VGVGLLDERVAIVTGGGRGIGRGIGLELAREGARVVVNDVGAALDGRGTDQDPAFTVCQEIKEGGGEAVPNYDDVSDFDAAARIVDTAVESFGRIDILVNNAGIVRDRSLLKMTPEDYDAVIAVHQKGTFNCTRHAALHMKEQGYGRIVNITSSAGLRGNFGQTNYAAAKAAIAGMTMVWAVELGKYGITVNAVAPGLTATEGVMASPHKEAFEFVQMLQCIPRRGEAVDIAPAVAFLASEEAAWVTGQLLVADGGMSHN
jgi:NAD(P)-dependent dehydrogenase (short-subunit alcohol dehydrogenase family)